MSNSLNLIENIVVVMLENRSFDQMLGTLYPASSQFEGLKLDGSMYNTSNGVQYPVTNTSSTSPYVTPTPDPGESFADMNLQIFNTTSPSSDSEANMAGFVNDWMATSPEYPAIPTGKQCSFAPSWPALPRTPSPSPGDTMFYFTPSQLPVTSTLAQAFGVSDGWFGSCPTQTYPNRFFLNCATSGGYVNDVDYPCNFELWPKLPSIFELLDGDGGYSPQNWKVYFHDIAISTLINYVLEAPAGMVCNFDTSDYGGESKLSTFAQDISNQKLPKYSFIEPRYGGIDNLPPNDNHPPFDVRNGEILLGTIYNLLRGSSYYWPRTLLIVTYDEHGGCFDHVIPPAAVPPGGTVLPNRYPSGFLFDRFGPRVPAILVSPYIPQGSVLRPAGFSYVEGTGTSTTNGVTPFDHTSVIRTIVECFGIEQNEQPANLTARDLNAPSLADALSLDSDNMNNGPASVELPDGDALIAAEVGEGHLAEIYRAMRERRHSAKPKE
jgi:phospholipase C